MWLLGKMLWGVLAGLLRLAERESGLRERCCSGAMPYALFQLGEGY